MKRLLILGGMTPDVTRLYYDTINRVTRTALGHRHTAQMYVYSADLEVMVQHASAGDWKSFARVYVDAIEALSGRVDGIVVSAILAHKVTARLIQAANGIPLLHVADCVAQRLQSQYPDIRTAGLLAPGITMRDATDPDFFIGRLQSAEHGFRVLVPETEDDLNAVSRGVLEEVAKGAAAVTPQTKAMFISQAERLIKRGAQAIILGSTDLGFVVREEDLKPGTIVIEPAAIHAEEAARWALEN
ncbi:Asp/Glu/hydantoin racemase [Xylariaceae sp. FL0255]|nr:Asp/Glu/hydantoin racemase [Xylariaceae sp. FL0255]